MTIPPLSTSTPAPVILPKLSDADQKKFDTVKANLQSALDTLKNASKNSNVNAQRKAMAQQKIAQIKQSLKTLQQFHGLDPKATAKMLAQLAKELAQAVKDYVSAGGNDASVTAGASVSATPAAGTAAPAPAATNASGSTGAPVPAPTATPGAAAANAYAQTQQVTSDNGASDAEDRQFLKDANDIKNQLRNYANQLRNSLKSKFMPQSMDPDLKDVREIDSALDEVDRSLVSLNPK
jgi:hypothetical protein